MFEQEKPENKANKRRIIYGTPELCKAAAIRAVRTVAQSALATIGTAAVLGDVNWLMVGSAAALDGILSLLTSVVTGLPEAKE